MINLQECIGIIVEKSSEQLDTFGRSMVEQYLRGQDVRSMKDIESLSRRLFGRTSTLQIEEEQSTAEEPSKSDRKDGKSSRRRKTRKKRSKKKKSEKQSSSTAGQAVLESRDDIMITANKENSASHQQDHLRKLGGTKKKEDLVGQKSVTPSPPWTAAKDKKKQFSTRLRERNNEETRAVSSSTLHELIPLCCTTGCHEFCADTEKFLSITCRFCGQEKTCESVHTMHLDYLLARRKRRFLDDLPYDLSLPLCPHTYIDIQSMMVAAGVAARVDITPCVTLVEGLPESDHDLLESVYESLLIDTQAVVTSVSTLPTESPWWHTIIANVRMPAWERWSKAHASDFPTVLPQWPTLRISLGLVNGGGYVVDLLNEYFTHNPFIYTSPEKMQFTSPDFPKMK